jgi:hypothetical protein
VLAKTRSSVTSAVIAREEENALRSAEGKKIKPMVSEALSFAIYFAKYMGAEIAQALVALDGGFEGTQSGENPSRAVRGLKRVDLNFSTRQSGLGLAMSFKSVHFGEEANGDAGFTHNMKRNDEELRVEATGHHLRQPYAVMVAVVFLPLESCFDYDTSSFGSWVEYLWPLRGRDAPEDPPDRFELVFIGLYSRSGDSLGFYEIGGTVGCPRKGRPSELLGFAEFLGRVKGVYDQRNGRDFFFEGEGPDAG